MNQVFGRMVLNVSVGVQSGAEYGVMEANYNLNPDRIIAYELVAVDSKGIKHKIDVHEALDVELDEFIGFDY